jgi:hypothetical protein
VLTANRCAVYCAVPLLLLLTETVREGL